MCPGVLWWWCSDVAPTLLCQYYSLKSKSPDSQTYKVHIKMLDGLEAVALKKQNHQCLVCVALWCHHVFAFYFYLQKKKKNFFRFRWQKKNKLWFVLRHTPSRSNQWKQWFLCDCKSLYVCASLYAEVRCKICSFASSSTDQLIGYINKWSVI